MIFHSMWLCVSLVRLFPGIWPDIGWFHKMSSFTTKVKDGPQQMTYNVQQNTTLFDPFFQRGFERTDKGGSLNSSLHADPFFVVSLTRSPRAIRNRLARLFLLGKKISVKHPWWANTFRKRIIFWLWMVFGWSSSKTQRPESSSIRNRSSMEQYEWNFLSWWNRDMTINIHQHYPMIWGTDPGGHRAGAAKIRNENPRVFSDEETMGDVLLRDPRQLEFT